MDKMIYLAMSGAKELMSRQAINNHNLANINTTGFKADLDAIQSVPVYGDGNPVTVFTQSASIGIDHSGGEIKYTGRNLDIAISGEGYMAVQDVSGNEGYTRAGDLRINAAGLLENGAGYPIMGNAGPIAIPPFEKLNIGADGTITIQPIGQSASTLAVIDRIKFIKPDTSELTKVESGIFHFNGEPPEADASVSLVSGSLESSNVNPVAAMVKMIEISRQYEMQVKMMKAVEDNDTAGERILSLN